MKKLTDIITGSLTNYDIEYRLHATRRMFHRDINENDIELILRDGNIIEQYNEDFPLPSVLISDHTSANRPLHLVVGVSRLEKKLIIITTYEPSSNKWRDNFSRRVE